MSPSRDAVSVCPLPRNPAQRHSTGDGHVAGACRSPEPAVPVTGEGEVAHGHCVGQATDAGGDRPRMRGERGSSHRCRRPPRWRRRGARNGAQGDAPPVSGTPRARTWGGAGRAVHPAEVCKRGQRGAAGGAQGVSRWALQPGLARVLLLQPRNSSIPARARACRWLPRFPRTRAGRRGPRSTAAGSAALRLGDASPAPRSSRRSEVVFRDLNSLELICFLF